jgi:hypothetical protein
MSLHDFKEQVNPDPWADQIFTLKDAYAPREPLSYVIDNLFPPGSLSIVYGPPGSLKSMLLSDAAMSTAAGTDWLGRKVTQGATSTTASAGPMKDLKPWPDQGRLLKQHRFFIIPCHPRG